MRPMIRQSQLNEIDSRKPRKVFERPSVRGYEEVPTIDLLASLLVGEAESKSIEQMRIIAKIVSNRNNKEDKRYGNDIREVMLKYKQFYGLSDPPARARIAQNFARGSDALQRARQVAYETMTGTLEVPDWALNATHFDHSLTSHETLKLLGEMDGLRVFQEE